MFVVYLVMPDLATNEGHGRTGEIGIQRQPLKIYDNFYFSDSNGVYPEPFVRKEEADGLLSGSEGWTLCSKGEPVYSHGFVQCAAALVRNKDTGLVTLIHQSTWSESADAAMALQRPDDIDVIIISGPFGGMSLENIKYAHDKDPKGVLDSIENIDRKASRKYRGGAAAKGNGVHIFRNYSALLGLSESELSEYVERLKKEKTVGAVNQIGNIEIPVAKGGANRWYLLYRPKENVIWIYESGARKLFKYQGF